MSSRPLHVAATVAILALLVTAGPPPAHATPAVGGSDVLGIYHGFFQSTSTSGLWGNLTFSISDVRNRRWTGMVDLITPTPDPSVPSVDLPFAVAGTIAASGEFTGDGKSSDGTMVGFHGMLAMIDGGAAVVDSTYSLKNPSGMSDAGTATLLRGFRNTGPTGTNMNGDWNGSFTSATTGGSGGVHWGVTQACAAPANDPSAPAPDPTAVEFEPNFIGRELLTVGDQEVTFFFLGSLAPDNHFAAIGWDVLNDRFVKIGLIAPQPDSQTPASLSAMFSVMLGGGGTDQGTLQLQQQLFPPNPCSIIGTSGS